VVVDKVVVVLDISSCNGVTQLVVVVELVGQGVLEVLEVRVNLAYLDHLGYPSYLVVLRLQVHRDFLEVHSFQVDPLDQELVVVVVEEEGMEEVVVLEVQERHMPHLVLQMLMVKLSFGHRRRLHILRLRRRNHKDLENAFRYHGLLI